MQCLIPKIFFLLCSKLFNARYNNNSFYNIYRIPWLLRDLFEVGIWTDINKPCHMFRSIITFDRLVIIISLPFSSICQAFAFNSFPFILKTTSRCDTFVKKTPAKVYRRGKYYSWKFDQNFCGICIVLVNYAVKRR